MVSISKSPPPRRPYLPRTQPAASAINLLARELLQYPSPVPLYHRLVQLMRELIRNGDFQPWEQLPSEQYVADHLLISRPTVRQAWQELETAHLIVRDHGKGTFIGPVRP